MLFSQDDERRRATEGVAAVGLQTRHAAQAAFPVLATGGRGKENAPDETLPGLWRNKSGALMARREAAVVGCT